MFARGEIVDETHGAAAIEELGATSGVREKIVL
jgi:hypothetical protein